MIKNLRKLLLILSIFIVLGVLSLNSENRSFNSAGNIFNSSDANYNSKDNKNVNPSDDFWTSGRFNF